MAASWSLPTSPAPPNSHLKSRRGGMRSCRQRSWLVMASVRPRRSPSEPEAICEVADIVRDKVTDMLWTVWPACSADGKPVEPRVSTDKPSGYAARAITPPTESANLKPAGAADDLYAADERPPSRSATHTFNTSRTTAHGFGALSASQVAQLATAADALALTGVRRGSRRSRLSSAEHRRVPPGRTAG